MIYGRKVTGKGDNIKTLTDFKAILATGVVRREG